MSPMVKRVLTVLAAKKAYDYVQERGRPQRSFLARVGGPTLAVAAAGGAIALLSRSGGLGSLTERARSLRGGGSPPAPPTTSDVSVPGTAAPEHTTV